MSSARRALVLPFLLAPAAFAQTARPDAFARATDAANGDQYGFSIALDGSRAAIGVVGDDGPFGSDFGSVRVVERQTDGSWTEVAKVTAFDWTALDQFGFSVALDGDTLLVGSPGDDDGGSASGAAYVYERQPSGTWQFAAKLVAPDPALGDFFGRAVALSGNRAVVGSVLDDTLAGINSGSVYVYERDPLGNWTYWQHLVASDTTDLDRFGSALAIDGDRLVVGAPYRANSAGGAYVFDRSTSTGLWTEHAVLELAGAVGGEFFGDAVALDGDTVVIGAPQDGGSGSARVFDRSTLGVWSESATLLASSPLAGGEFGGAVALDGARAAIGAVGQGAAGSVTLLERTTSGWFEVAEFEPGGSAPGNGYGAAVALSGARLGVGMTGDSTAFSNGGSLAVTELGTLLHGESELSVASGGSSALLLRAGPAHAGHLFVVLGSLTGTSPGTLDPASGLTVPLVVDAYTLLLIQNFGAGLVGPFAGGLDAFGRANSQFLLPAGTSASFVGKHVHHACLCVDLTTFVADLATNAVSVELVP